MTKTKTVKKIFSREDRILYYAKAIRFLKYSLGDIKDTELKSFVKSTINKAQARLDYLNSDKFQDYTNNLDIKGSR